MNPPLLCFLLSVTLTAFVGCSISFYFVNSIPQCSRPSVISAEVLDCMKVERNKKYNEHKIQLQRNLNSFIENKYKERTPPASVFRKTTVGKKREGMAERAKTNGGSGGQDGKVKVLCWVATFPENHVKKAIHVKNTWGKRCDKLIFMSSQYDSILPTVQLNGTGGEGREVLWGKTRAAFKYIYEVHFHEADWFLKADDNLYVVMENLREMLLHFNASQPLHMGFRYKHLFLPRGYMSGGAGYLLSKEALKRFVQVGLVNSRICTPDPSGFEDMEMGRCLGNLGVEFVDTRDGNGRTRFHPMHIRSHFTSGEELPSNWLPTNRGSDCCSDKPITFHETTPNEMYIYEFLLHNVKPVDTP